MNPRLSIIIATHKRPGILEHALHHLEEQTIADKIEVIVVSDGPDTDTAELMEHKFDIKTTYLEIEKRQQGVARNRGVLEASGDYCMFINDDIFLDNDCCEQHVRAHERMDEHDHYPSAVLGFTTWDPSLDITPAMQWLEASGWQFGYDDLLRYRDTFIFYSKQHRYTYSSHVSLPTRTVKKYPFREDVTMYGWEDIEWGKRLADAGVRLYYEPNATAMHHHRITLEDSLKRMETIGKSAVIMKRNDPTFDRLPSGWKLWVYNILALMPTMRGKHAAALLRGIRG